MTDTIDASSIAGDVRSGRRRARDVVDDALARIGRDETNAVVTLGAEAARACAERVDAAVARGEDPGPLGGVPFTVKDTIATKGLRATGGSLVLADHVARADATVVSRLRSAGAVLIGKTNCPEFALQARTDNRVFGPTSHPLGPDWSPGGSSGGCAAAVAGGLVPFSIGGDYGGSVRYPAACTGIYGLRPTYLRVPVDGHVPEPAPGSARRRFQTVGPLARSARDVALVFGVLAADTPGTRSDPAATVRRIGIVRGGWTCTAEVAGAVEVTAGALADAGFDVVDIDPGPFVEAAEVFDAWRAADDYADLRALVEGRERDLTPHIARLLAKPPIAWSDDLTARHVAVTRAVGELLATAPVLVLPVARVGVMTLGSMTVEIGGRTESVDALQILAPSRAVSLLGLPALAVPASSSGRGMPVGVQLVGPADSERVLVSVSRRLGSAPALGDSPVPAVDDYV